MRLNWLLKWTSGIITLSLLAYHFVACSVKSSVDILLERTAGALEKIYHNSWHDPAVWDEGWFPVALWDCGSSSGVDSLLMATGDRCLGSLSLAFQTSLILSQLKWKHSMWPRLPAFCLPDTCINFWVLVSHEHHMTSHDITWHHMTSHDHHMLMSCHVREMLLGSHSHAAVCGGQG